MRFYRLPDKMPRFQKLQNLFHGNEQCHGNEQNLFHGNEQCHGNEQNLFHENEQCHGNEQNLICGNEQYIIRNGVLIP